MAAALSSDSPIPRHETQSSPEDPSSARSAADAAANAPALMLDPERVLLHALVRGLRPERVLEIGTHRGGSTMIMCAALDDIGEGVIVCIDPNPVIDPHDWERLAHRTSVIDGMSPDAVPQAAEVAGGSFDFVLIDGDHTTEGVRRDLEGVLPLLAPGSHVLFHDSHYWQVGAAIDQSLVAFSHVLVDCGALSRQEQPEARVEAGHPVVWGGLRLLRYVGPLNAPPPQMSDAVVEGGHPVDKPHPIRRIRRIVTAPLKRYLDNRFDHLEELVAQTALVGYPERESKDVLSRVDVSLHNAEGLPPTFDTVISQVVSAAQFLHPDFQRLHRLMFPNVGLIPCGAIQVPSTTTHRKLWEWCYILRAAEQHGKLASGAKAVGFGVGSEPLPAALAHFGLTVLATDREPDASGGWAASGQHMASLQSLSKANVVPDDVLERLVTARYMDMNEIPDDLGRFDLVWSSCALEHLGTPEAGLDFVMNTLDLLNPGGLAVHTTELELTPRGATADYGHLAIYRTVDLDGLASRVREAGFEIDTNWYVSMETPADRFVSVPPYAEAHLKLAVGDSVSTSVGLLISRPA
jgi:predicted O-methyltransferase YrrM